MRLGKLMQNVLTVTTSPYAPYVDRAEGKNWLKKTTKRINNLGELLKKDGSYTAARTNPESRMATRALGDRSDLGMASLTLGDPAPAPTMRSLDSLLADRTNHMMRVLGRWST